MVESIVHVLPNSNYMVIIRRKSILLFTIFFLIFASIVKSQTAPDTTLLKYFRFEDEDSFSFLFTLFPPVLIENGIDLKTFIRSNDFQLIRTHYGDLKALDAIYIRAMQLTNNNTGISLLLSTFAVFDHRIIGFKIPFFKLYIPLSNESEEEFSKRIQHLPLFLFPGNVSSKTGDRDKLQHFFGSAFITYITESRSVAERFGRFIERGEDTFIVGGVDDKRDDMANSLGQEFGLSLMNDYKHLPSEFFLNMHANTNSQFIEHESCWEW